MSEHVDLTEIFLNVVDAGVPHCRICYRTSKEIALVRPNKLLDFASSFKLQHLFGSSALDKSACMICESTAATAVRVRDALLNAASIKEIMENFKHNIRHQTKKTQYKFLKQNVQPSNMQLNGYRDRTTFKQTEVLIIDSLGLEWSNKTTGKDPTRVDLSTGARVDPPIETVVLEDDEESTKASKTISQRPNQNTILNLGLPAPKKLVPINHLIEKITDKSNYAALVPNKLQLITGHESLPEHFILHDIVVGKDGTLTVPGISSEIKDGELIYNPLLTTAPLLLIQPALNTPAKNYVNNIINNNLNTTAGNVKPKSAENKKSNSNSVQKNSNDLLVKDTNNSNNSNENGWFLGTLTRNNKTFEGGESSNINIVDIQGATKDAEQITDSIEFIEVESILKKSLHNHKRSAKTNVDLTKNTVDLTKNTVDLTKNSDDLTKKPRMELKVNMNINNSCLIPEPRPLAVISAVTSQAVQLQAETTIVEAEQHSVDVPKRPIEQRGNIDWENKIPMDVISFMDATDPNAGDLIVPDPLPKEPETVIVKDEVDEYVIELS